MTAAVRRFFGEGFRVFFLAAGGFAVLAVLGWLVWFLDAAPGPLALTASPQLWHAHEMVFGYPAAALGGFFLTAVPNWTGARAARNQFIALVAAIWAAGRVAMVLSGVLSPGLVAVIDLAFLPVLGAKILTQLLKRPKPQNMMFLGLLAMIWLANLRVHLDWTGLGWGDAAAGLRAGLLATAAMIAVLGGRVIPAFTRNAMLRAGVETGLPRQAPRLAAVGIASAIAAALAVLFGLPEAATGGLLVLAGTLQAARLSGWRGRWTFGQPILWTLHLSFALLAFGHVLMGAAALGFGSDIAALHVMGIGGVGGMTLAVMSRATLGHSGRPLVAPAPLALAYALLPVAAALRWVASGVPDAHFAGIAGSGAAWVAAFTLYLVALWPAFRDGRAAPDAE